jgi:hypothetical protein
MGRFYKPTNFTPEEVMFELPKEAVAGALNYVDTNLTLNDQTTAELNNSFDSYYKNLLEFDQPAAKEYLAKYKPAIEEITSKMANSQDWRNHQGALTALSRDFQKDINTGNLSKWLGNKQAYDAHVKDIEDKVKLGVDKGGMSKIAGDALKAEAYKKLESTTSYDGKDWHKYAGETLQEFDIAKHVQTYIDNFKQQVTPLHSKGWEENGNYIVENNGVRKEYKIRDMEKGALLDIQNNPSLRYQAERFNKLGLYQGKLDAPLYNETEVTDPNTGQKVKQYEPNLENTYMRLIHPQVLTRGSVEINPNVKVEKSVIGEMTIDNNQAKNSKMLQDDQQAFLAQEAEKENQRKIEAAKQAHKNSIELKGKAEGSGSGTTGEDSLGTELVSEGVTNISPEITANTHKELVTTKARLENTKAYIDKLPAGQEKDALLSQYNKDNAELKNKKRLVIDLVRKTLGKNTRGLNDDQLFEAITTENNDSFTTFYTFDDETGKAYKKQRIVGRVGTENKGEEISFAEYKRKKVKQDFDDAAKGKWNITGWGREGGRYNENIKTQSRSIITGEYRPTDATGTSNIINALKLAGDKVYDINLTNDTDKGTLKSVNQVTIDKIGLPTSARYSAGAIIITNDKGQEYLSRNRNVIKAYLNNKLETDGKLNSADIEIYNDNDDDALMSVKENIIPKKASTISTTIKHNGNQYPVTYEVEYLPSMDAYNAYTVINGIKNPIADNPVALDLNSITRWIANPPVKK